MLWKLTLVTLALTESALCKDSYKIPSRLWYNGSTTDVSSPLTTMTVNKTKP
jgi:hypothetical protein